MHIVTDAVVFGGIGKGEKAWVYSSSENPEGFPSKKDIVGCSQISIIETDLLMIPKMKRFKYVEYYTPKSYVGSEQPDDPAEGCDEKQKARAKEQEASTLKLNQKEVNWECIRSQDRRIFFIPKPPTLNTSLLTNLQN